MKKITVPVTAIALSVGGSAMNPEPIPFGDFNSWVTRNIRESRVIGGKVKQVYAVGPEESIDGDEPYTNRGGSPWSSSNVMAKVVGITKISNAVYPDRRSDGDKCARLCTQLENCKAIGIINIDVMVAGSLFLGQMFEPIRSTSNPYSKMEMGIPFTGRPTALCYDYKLEIPADAGIVHSNGFGKKKTYPGTDKAEVFIILQRRWEDEDRNLYAKRVGTGRERLDRSTDDWINGHRLAVNYGDITDESFYKPYMALISEENSYYACNSEGEMVPVREVGWDDADATPTHLIVMFSSGSGKPYTGTPGMTLWIDNVALTY